MTNTGIPDGQKKSEAYWRQATTTYLAAPDYYDKQEAALAGLLASHGPFTRVADVGCGDGRYTLLALEYADTVLGLDIGPALLEGAARRKAAHALGRAAEFSLGSFSELASKAPFDLTLCLGVTSAVLDEAKFVSALDDLVRATRPGGVLITKDTLAFGPTFTSEQGNYVAIYRNKTAYIEAICAKGCVLLECVELIRATDTTSNCIYVFRRNA